ncbi:endonuclease/exonuclease/phosphatase family protein [Streptomyces sp. NBC_00996]|uniref:endonuclease/exonuclease/phosphatase family protein n=1 Tax=Streptomyces sp. NBC_00996 TaxID=2903710 RepID=UPI003866AA5B|nr:endonuclease/exonuclease/phosphatase family protein [Streptomyces sp. NBC_00996]
MDTAAAEWTGSERPVDERRAGRVAGAWAAGLLLAGVSVVIGCRAADSDGITPVPQLLAFLPWLLAPTGLALLLALLARWRIGMVWAVLLLGIVAWFIEPYGKTSEPGGAPLAELRVMTSNVEFGRGTGALIPVVRREKPDILFVEECEYGCSRALRDAFGGTDGVYPYREAVEGAGSDGAVIISRFPLTGADGVRGTMGMPGAVADVRGHDVRLQLAHPMPPLPGQLGVWRRELGELRDYAAHGSGPTIMAGDFNASQDHAAFRRVLDTGLRDSARLAGDPRTPSWPARTTPTLGAQIDHVLVSEDFSANKATFPRITGTDHRALVVDLTLHQRR